MSRRDQLAQLGIGVTRMTYPFGDALVDRATHLASIAVERQRTEDELRESERRFSTAFYSSPGCLTITRAADSANLSRAATSFGA